MRDVRQVLDATAFVPPDVVALTAWVSRVLHRRAAARRWRRPCRRTRSTAASIAFKTIRMAALTAAGLDTVDRVGVAARCAGDADAGVPRLGARQREALQLLAGSPDGMPAPDAGRARRAGVHGLAAGDDGPRGDPAGPGGSRSVRGRGVDEPAGRRPRRDLTEEQRVALDHLRPLAARGAFHVALIQGVTGSGKTELYLRLADAVRTSGRGVLMLVPEIALTPQVAALFRARFGASVAIQHSGLSDGERHDQWHRIRRGDVNVVIGTRSAVFAPLARPGLIIVDEEHDTSYKQDETPALSRPGRGGDARQVRRRARRARVRHADARVVRQREGRPLLAHHARAARARSPARPGADRQHARGDRGGRRRGGAEPPPARGHRVAPRAEGAVSDPPEPARLRLRGVLPAVRHRASIARTAASSLTVHTRGHDVARALPLLQLRQARAEDVSELRGAVHGARGLRDRARRGRDARGVPGRARGARRSRLRSGARAA